MSVYREIRSFTAFIYVDYTIFYSVFPRIWSLRYAVVIRDRENAKIRSYTEKYGKYTVVYECIQIVYSSSWTWFNRCTCIFFLFISVKIGIDLHPRKKIFEKNRG